MAYAAIEAVIPWEQFTVSVAQAERLSRDEAFDPLALLTDYFSSLRKYAPSFLEAFKFRGASVAKSFLDAIQLLRGMNQSGAGKVPADAARGRERRSRNRRHREHRCGRDLQGFGRRRSTSR
ncbi:MAG: hypothetical protein M3N97_09155 [Pseudomonadota bacterium]|nr:hypothetical protein [Pseudomonadota bacterium]